MRDTSDKRGGSAIQPRGGLTFDGMLAGHPSVTLTGTAAYGVGISATKGLLNSDSNVSLVTPAIGLRASAETSLIKVSYDGNGVASPPMKIGFGLDVASYALLGGAVKIEYTPPYKVEFGVEAGAGIGEAISIYSVGTDVKEGSQ